MNRYGRQLVTAAAVVAVATGAVVVRDRVVDRPTRAVAAAGEVTPAGQVLVGLLDRGREGTYRARYQVRGMEGTGATAPWLDVYRQGRQRYRQDASPTETQRGGQRGYVVDGAVTRCVQEDSGPWRCAAVPDPADRPDQLAENLRDELRGAVVQEGEPRTIAGRAARCFRYGAEALDTEVCVGADGVPLRLAHGDRAIELVSLTGAVSDADFVPPGRAG